jgi:beta-glucosidase-like glycosyl hydrolase
VGSDGGELCLCCCAASFADSSILSLDVEKKKRVQAILSIIRGEDPYLGFVSAQGVISGIQSQGVIANAKHYINNNIETDRRGVSADIDERTEAEIYLRPFAGAIEAGVGSVMW